MGEYARLGERDVGPALALVAAYFSESKTSFVRRFFAGRSEVLQRATGEESYRQIVESLGNPVQAAIVAASPGRNMLVLAGPGSGKTRVVVHRCAYLVRVERVPAHGILVVCFSRAAAQLVRRRLEELIGPEAHRVAVQTYHGLALRLTGRSLAERAEAAGSKPPDFDEMVEDAASLLEGSKDKEMPGLPPDELRERLLAGYQHVLVDEYQDIDERQYRLLSAIAGRTAEDEERKLSILAVGDDDQNIYGWRGANVEFLRRFEKDYRAEPHHLVENYRSTAHIISAANQLIRANQDRMKKGHDVRVNSAREKDAPGGRWAELDPVSRGRVQLLEVEDAPRQAVAVVEELGRLYRLSPVPEWGAFAVLARSHRELGLVRALCEHQGIPVRWSLPREKAPPLYRIREVARFLDAVKRHRDELFDAARLEELLPPAALEPAPANPWAGLLRELVEAWREESGGAELAADAFLELAYETLAESRRELSLRAGVFLGTLHAAKGLEFDHVLLPVGDAYEGESVEEARRVHYVGMTRARQTLCLVERRDARSPLLAGLDGPFLLRRPPAELPAVPDGVLGRRYELLGMKDLFLDFAGSRSPDDAVHAHLAALEPGALLRPVLRGDFIELQDGEGHNVAALSQAARGLWRERLGRIEEIRVVAMVQRTPEDSGEEYRSRLRCERWEVPVAEVVYRE